jgi:hypothetical protein
MVCSTTQRAGMRSRVSVTVMSRKLTETAVSPASLGSGEHACRGLPCRHDL